ncbi:hypothetical protein IAU60_004482 [Kwoniella sp. DSM 27419]
MAPTIHRSTAAMFSNDPGRRPTDEERAAVSQKRIGDALDHMLRKFDSEGSATDDAKRDPSAKSRSPFKGWLSRRSSDKAPGPASESTKERTSAQTTPANGLSRTSSFSRKPSAISKPSSAWWTEQ